MSTRPGLLTETFTRLRKDPLGMTGLVIVVVILLASIFASQLAPHDPLEVDVYNRLQNPTRQHWLGTDQLGRDVLSRVLLGGRIALKVALIAISVSLGAGLLLGMLAGFGPTWLDRLLVVCFDTLRSFPTIMFALAIVALTGPSLNTVIGVIIITSIPLYARIVRTQTQALRDQDFILAERAMGVSTARILSNHILPNIAAPLLIMASMDVPAVVGIEAGLSFLGLGVSPPTPSWGNIIFENQTYFATAPWLVFIPGAAILLLALSFNLVGDALHDALDPTQRGRG